MPPHTGTTRHRRPHRRRAPHDSSHTAGVDQHATASNARTDRSPSSSLSARSWGSDVSNVGGYRERTAPDPPSRNTRGDRGYTMREPTSMGLASQADVILDGLNMPGMRTRNLEDLTAQELLQCVHFLRDSADSYAVQLHTLSESTADPSRDVNALSMEYLAGRMNSSLRAAQVLEAIVGIRIESLERARRETLDRARDRDASEEDSSATVET